MSWREGQTCFASDGMSDFERIDLDPEYELAHYEKPDYAQVIFHNIAETYPTDANIECEYTITAPLVVASRDWLGLYRVGWSSHRDYIYFMWAPLPSGYQPGQEVNGKVPFKAQCLPKDDGEFYQFCYVTSKGFVRGASTPFQFKHPTVNDFVGIEVGDMMIIKTRTAALEENLAAAVGEKEKLVKHMSLLELERDSLLIKLVDIEKRVTEEKEDHGETSKQLAETQDRKMQLENEVTGMTKITDSLREKLSVLNQEKIGLEKKVEEKDDYISSLQEKIKALINEMDALCGKNKSLEQEKELFKNHFTTSEKTIQTYQISIEKYRKQIGAYESASALLSSKNAELKTQLEEGQKKVHQLVEEQDNECKSKKVAEDQLTSLDGKLGVSQEMCLMLKEKSAAQSQTISRMSTEIEKSRELLEQRLRNTEDKLCASEEMSNMLKNETQAHCQVIAKMSSDLEAAKTEAHNLKIIQTNVEREHKAEKTSWLDEKTELQANIRVYLKEEERLLAKVSELVERLGNAEEKSSVEKGSLYALQMAQSHLQERYSKMKKQCEELRKQCDEHVAKKQSQEAKESDLRREITDLKERLAMGADEYKTKYLEARKLESEIRRLRRQLRQFIMGEYRGRENGPETEHLQKSGRQTSEAATTATAETSEVATSSSVETSEMGTIVKADTADTGTITKTPESLLDSGSQTDETYDMPELEEVLVESVEGSKSKTAMAPLVADLTTMELQTQLAELGQELTMRRNKQHKYKQLYLEEKEKTNYLQKHYFGEVEKKEKEVHYMESRFEEEQTQLRYKIVSLERTIEAQRQQLGNLHSLTSSGDQAAASATGAAEVVRELDPLVNQEDTTMLTAPLTPLPAPIQPEVLPIAKMVAIKRINEANISELGLLMAAAQSDDDGPPPLEPNDHDEDRFHDADGDPQKLCPVCNTTFPAELPQYVFEDHVDGHYGPVCPMCQEQFSLGFDQDHFEQHVLSHFDGGN